MSVSAAAGAAQSRSVQPSAPDAYGSTDLERALALRRQRRRRDLAFQDRRIFQDPAWDLLLDLFIAHERGRPQSVTSAGGGSVASTTAIRWLVTLEREGLATSRRDPTDGRRRLVELTPEAVASMRQFLAAT